MNLSFLISSKVVEHVSPEILELEKKVNYHIYLLRGSGARVDDPSLDGR